MYITTRIENFNGFIFMVYEKINKMTNLEIDHKLVNELIYGETNIEYNIDGILASYRNQMEYSHVYFKKIKITENGNIYIVLDTYDVKGIGNDINQELKLCYNIDVSETIENYTDICVGNIIGYTKRDTVEIDYPEMENTDFTITNFYTN